MHPDSFSNSNWRVNAVLAIAIIMGQTVPEVFPLADYASRATSLTFVFDTTGSMGDEMQQMKAKAREILGATADNPNTPIYNLILVPFSDPDAGPALVTRDQDEFVSAINALHPEGGDDCPEMSVSGIISALEVSLPGSKIYVFTDASAKDHERGNEALALLQETGSQVILVLTGECNGTDGLDYKVYEDIASSSGQLFRIRKDQVIKVIDLITETVRGQEVNLISTDFMQPASQSHWLPVDTRLQRISISFGGDSRSMVLRDPRGELIPVVANDSTGLPDGPHLVESLTLGNTGVFVLAEPAPGNYTLNLYSSSKSSLRVQGISPLDFEYEFTTAEGGAPMDNSTKSLVPGARTNMIITADKLNPGENLTTVQFLNMTGHVIPRHDYDLEPHLNLSGVYVVQTDFIPPAEKFYIRVRGVDSENYVLQRLAAAAVRPSLPSTEGSVGCRYGYIPWSRSCYRFVRSWLAFKDARRVCQKDGGDLVAISSGDENVFVTELTRGVRSWIGGQRTSKGDATFRWVSGEQWGFENWRVHGPFFGPEPNNWGGLEDCIETNYVGSAMWNDHFCWFGKPFTCEIAV